MGKKVMYVECIWIPETSIGLPSTPTGASLMQATEVQ